MRNDCPCCGHRRRSLAMRNVQRYAEIAEKARYEALDRIDRDRYRDMALKGDVEYVYTPWNS